MGDFYFNNTDTYVRPYYIPDGTSFTTKYANIICIKTTSVLSVFSYDSPNLLLDSPSTELTVVTVLHFIRTMT